MGTAIGLMYYLGTTLAASLYALGAVEVFQIATRAQNLFDFDTEIEAIGLAVVLATVVYVGVKYVNMAGQAFLAVVFASIACSFIGLSLNSSGARVTLDENLDLVPGDNWGASYELDPATGRTPSFTSLVALMYPSVTGFLAGTNRSGNLKNPSTSIPKGTFGTSWTHVLCRVVTHHHIVSYSSRERVLGF